MRHKLFACIMKFIKLLIPAAILATIAFQCSPLSHSSFKARTVYQSRDLEIIQVSNNAFQHISYKQTNDFGNVPCNGVVVRDGNEAIVFDTPTNDKSAEVLIKWIQDSLHCQVNAVIPTHFHDDCLGGLQAFNVRDIPSHAYFRTIELAKEYGLPVPRLGFSDSLKLRVGDTYIVTSFLGEGHTRDNVVGYFPNEQVLFGGCLIKAHKASKGYLDDANVQAWSATVEAVKQAYPNVQVVVPGHGDYGNRNLLDYTINLFKRPQ
jgi:metallo-beta-lactamase class B